MILTFTYERKTNFLYIYLFKLQRFQFKPFVLFCFFFMYESECCMFTAILFNRMFIKYLFQENMKIQQSNYEVKAPE